MRFPAHPATGHAVTAVVVLVITGAGMAAIAGIDSNTSPGLAARPPAAASGPGATTRPAKAAATPGSTPAATVSAQGESPALEARLRPVTKPGTAATSPASSGHHPTPGTTPVTTPPASPSPSPASSAGRPSQCLVAVHLAGLDVCAGIRIGGR